MHMPDLGELYEQLCYTTLLQVSHNLLFTHNLTNTLAIFDFINSDIAVSTFTPKKLL